MKRFFGILLALVLVLSGFGLQAEAWSSTYGECGDNLTWRFDSATSTLVISGTGKMYSYKERNDTESVWGAPPWGGLEVKAVRIGDGVETLGEYAFWGLDELEEFTLPERFTSVPAGTFGKCTSLKKIELHDGITGIGAQAFKYCESLTEMVIPEGVSSIGYSAFQYCSGLQSITLPSTLVSIGANAFHDCPSVTDVYYNGSGEQWDAVSGTGSLENAQWHGIGISSPTASVDEELSVTPPVIRWTEVPGAEGYAVFRSSSKTGTYSELTQLTDTTYTDRDAQISNGYYYYVRAYDADTDTWSASSDTVYCFYKAARPEGDGCGESLTWIFDEATGTLTISGTGDMDDYVVINENRMYESIAPWGELPVKYVELHEGITGIGEGAFWGAAELTGITIPEGVTRLGRYAFKDCTALAYADLPESLTDMSGESIFSGCSSLTQITIPSQVTKMGFGGFSGCSALESVQLPMGLTAIAGSTFSGCQALTTVRIPESVTSISGNAFSGCINLAQLRIPESVTKIENSAFYNCKALTELNIPEGVTSIGGSAFYGCEKIQQLKIPAGIMKIEEYTFQRCYALEEIWLPARISYVGGYAFYACDSLTTVHFGGTPDQKNRMTIYSGNLELENAVWECTYTNFFPAPQISVENNTLGGPVVSWDAIPGAEAYEVSIATEPDGEFVVTWPSSTVGATTFRYNNLAPGVQYYFRARVKETGSIGSSDYSNVVSAYRKLGVSQPKVKMPCSGETILSWDAVSEATVYEVWRATAIKGEYEKLATTTDVTYTDLNPKRFTDYYYRLVALHENPNSHSDLSAAGSAESYRRAKHTYGDWERVSEPSAHAPGEERRTCSTCGGVETRSLEALDLTAPVVKVSGNTATGKPKLSWKAVEGADLYRIYRAAGSTGSYSYYKSTRSTEFTDTEAKAGTNYYYKVLARNEETEKNSPYSNVVSRCCDLAKPVVTLKVDTASGKPKVTFEKIAGAEKYYIVRSTSRTGTYSKLATITGTSYIDKTAKVGTNYYYKVKALHAKDAADSAYSDITNRVCDLAKPVVSITRKNGDPKISWETVTGAEKYYVYRSTSKDGDYTKVYTAKTARSYTDTNVKAGKTYYYKVKAIHSNEAANSAYSAIKYITAK